tara:strand:- start:1495 stop:2235 length:741 start_codon:yes stop_codon:yes gene_type:complete
MIKTTTKTEGIGSKLARHNLSPKTLQLIDVTLNQPKHVASYKGISLVINPKVFPFDSISHSSISMANYLSNEECESVLDMGTGCGLQAIVAHLRGAKHVLAVDVDPLAIQNVKENIKRLGLEDKIDVLRSDLFDSIPLVRFDKILAQLPFSNIDYKNEVSHLLFDPSFKLHERFLSQAGKYLKQGGKIVLAGGDLGDERKLYSLIETYGYFVVKEFSSSFNNLNWKIYEISKKVISGDQNDSNEYL